MPFPNNPTGAIMEKADLEAIVQVVKEHDPVSYTHLDVYKRQGLQCGKSQ